MIEFLIVLAVVIIIVTMWKRRKAHLNISPASARSSHQSGVGVESVTESIIRLPKLNFLGQASVSPNGRYRFAWQDADYRGGRVGGSRVSGVGQVILLDRETLRYRMDLERPNDGAVSDVGIAVVNDWHFGSDLSGTFYVLSRDGAVIVSKRFSANLLTCGISPDGMLAWCTTANAPSPDGTTLTVFEITTGVQVGQYNRPEGVLIDVAREDDIIVIKAEEDVTYR